jgi:hypothetical protein
MYRHAFVLLLAAAFSLPFAFAQTTFGVITGIVTDATGSVVPGVKITARNEGTNITHGAVSDERGDYLITHLNAGTYSVSVSHQGFRRFVTTGILLATAATVRVDVPLQVGELASEVTVTGGAPLVESESSNLAGIRSNDVMVRMPINVRGSFNGFFYDMLQLTPGAQKGTGSAYSLGGTRASQTQFTLDGTTTNSPMFGNAIGPAQTSMESTRELRVDLANNKAEYNLPGVITGATKSGENSPHGSLFYYHDNGAFNARNTFSTRVPFNIAHDAGGSIGGPVFIPKVYDGRNRTFFFYTYESFPSRSERVSAPNVPTVSMRRGDFSSLLPRTVIRNPSTGEPFPNNQIPAGMLSSVSTKLQERFYPLPNYGPMDAYVGNWRGNIRGRSFKHHQDVRIDHKLTDANSMFGRLTYGRMGGLVSDSDLPTVGNRQQNRKAAAVTIADTHIINPQTINEFRYGMVWNTNPYDIPVDGRALIQEVGIQGLSPTLPDVSTMPFFDITGFTSISTSEPFGYVNERTHNFADNVTWLRQAHSLKAGVEVRRNMGKSYPLSPRNAFGQWGFAGTYSGFAYADFLLGIPQTSSRGNIADPAELVNTDWSFYVQDDWKITRRLTLNLGVRYDLNPPYHEKHSRFFQFDPATGRVVVPDEKGLAAVNALFPKHLIPVALAKDAGFPGSLFRTDKSNFAPRFGFAYRPLASADFVVRGGYGIYIDPNTASLYNASTGGPFISNESFTNSITAGVPLFRFPQGFPAGFGAIGSQSFSPIDVDLRNPYIQQWNVTAEKEVLRMGVRVSYIGTTSRKLVWAQNINQPLPGTAPFNNNMRRFPAIRDINYRVNGGTSTYNSLHVVAERKNLNGLYYQLGWTWAKNLTDVIEEGETGSRPENSYFRAAERGNVPYMARHRVVGQLLYTLPFGPGRPWFSNMRGVPRAIFAGWTISSALTAQTGAWFHPTFSGYDVSNTNTVGGRPDRIASGVLPSDQRTIYRWFDPSAFVVPGDLNGDFRPDVAVGRFGNSGVNILDGPGLFLLNGGVHKDVMLKERVRFLIQFTATNVLNHVNYNNPSTNISAPASVAQIRSAQAARGGQLGLRIEF